MECDICHNEFECHSADHCWCFELPQIPELAKLGEHCLCKQCLITRMASFLNESDLEISNDLMGEIALLGVPVSLKEGVDYVLNDNALMVLTRWYLMRRGYCCKNDCLNCPY